MNFSSAHSVSHGVSELAEDIYQSRGKFNRGDFLYLPYRVSVSDTDGGLDDDFSVNFYTHVVIHDYFIWYTISEQADFSIDHDTLIFPDERDSKDPGYDPYVRGFSTRRYVFGDLIAPAIGRKVEGIMAGMKKPGSPFLWDTFPLTSFKASDKVKQELGLIATGDLVG